MTNSEFAEKFKKKTKQFALRILKTKTENI